MQIIIKKLLHKGISLQFFILILFFVYETRAFVSSFILKVNFLINFFLFLFEYSLKLTDHKC